jgi:hypothetical protein
MRGILSNDSHVSLDYLQFLGGMCWGLKFTFLDIKITAKASDALANLNKLNLKDEDLQARVFSSMSTQNFILLVLNT